MSLEITKNRVAGIIEPVIESMGIELVDVELNKMRRKVLLRVYIDREGGITIDDCERVSREIEGVLDVEDPIQYSYVLEVSSPGLDRPLKAPKDFKRFSGNMVRVVTNDPIEEQTFFVGKLEAADENEIVLALPKDKKVTIPFDNISRAKLEVEI
jgi:ribosome maturation factor RimP